MTEPTPEDIAWLADRDRLRAAVGADRLAEAARRAIGDQQLEQALLQALSANDADLRRRDPRVELWSDPAEPGWGWDDDQ
jgi:hypothetical protein